MKKMRRILSIMLATMMVMAMGITASASELTVTGKKDGHTYEVYQLLKGEFDTLNGNQVIKNAEFGSGVKDTLKTTYSNDAYEFLKAIDGKTGEEVLALVDGMIQNPSTMTADQATPTKYTLSGLEKGYYLIKDEDNSLAGKESDAYTKYILIKVDQNDEAVAAKMDVPEVEKKVKENSNDMWNDVADYNIGDEVPFKLSTKVINATTTVNGQPVYVYDTYKTYKLNFVDTMSDGLTYVPNSVVVKKNGTALTGGYTVVPPTTTSGGTLTIKFADIKAAPVSAGPGDEITVEFKAVLNDNCKRMKEGNPNKVYLEFSNNPNDNGEGEPEGKTPEDKVIVFTYDLPGEKVDGADDSAKLAGAKFVFYKKDGNNTLYAQFTDADANDLRKVTGWVANKADATVLTTVKDKPFGFKGLDQGTYYLEEIEAPEGFNMPADPVTTVVIEATEDDGTDIYNNDNDLEVEKITVNGEENGKVVIINNKGIQLPETGGIGTTIFYVIGAALMIGAGVVLVTRRRMAK